MKFRVWNKILNKFDEDIALTQDGSILTYDWHNDYGKSWGGIYSHEEENYVVQFFTGLSDKNGKEIYEGDIILNEIYNGNVMEIIWDKKRLTYRGKNKKMNVSIEHRKNKIIGNIFEQKT